VRPQCNVTQEHIQKPKICRSSLAKNLEGELHLLERFREKCERPECETLRTVHALRLNVAGHEPCDFKEPKHFDVAFYVKDLTHAFIDDGNNRGVRAGTSGGGAQAWWPRTPEWILDSAGES
jgi:hypothetical protein